MSGPCLSQSYNFRSNLWTVAIEGRQYCGLLYWSYTHYYDKLIDGEKKTHTHTQKKSHKHKMCMEKEKKKKSIHPNLNKYQFTNQNETTNAESQNNPQVTH